MRKILFSISKCFSDWLSIISLSATLIFTFFPVLSESIIIKLVYIMFVIVTLFLIIINVLMRSYTEMPKITGLSVTDARKILNIYKLQFDEGFKSESTEIIIFQKPIKGEIIKKGESIYIETKIQKQNILLEMDNYDLEVLKIPELNSNGDPYSGSLLNINYGNGVVYSGQYENGIPNGNGLYSTSCVEYNGNFVNGIPQGYGIIKFLSSGDTYKGKLVLGKAHGEGHYSYANGNEYIGNWVNGNLHGSGVFNFKNGEGFKENWVNGKIQTSKILPKISNEGEASLLAALYRTPKMNLPSRLRYRKNWR